jgi:hypothetical protein
MKKKAWTAFTAARDHYREYVQSLGRELPELGALQQELVNRRAGPAYVVETPVVFNEALDAVSPKDDIRLILVADNPGRREQAAENRRYLVGPSGKLAEKFFRENPGLGIDFRRNVLILNKTPIHTPRTAELGELCRMGGPRVAAAVAASQEVMARLLLVFHQALSPVPVWITGYSEMKARGIFAAYTETLRTWYQDRRSLREKLCFYRHFSMNQFTIDLRQQTRPGEALLETLDRMGREYRKRILGW